MHSIFESRSRLACLFVILPAQLAVVEIVVMHDRLLGSGLALGNSCFCDGVLGPAGSGQDWGPSPFAGSFCTRYSLEMVLYEQPAAVLAALLVYDAYIGQDAFVNTIYDEHSTDCSHAPQYAYKDRHMAFYIERSGLQQHSQASQEMLPSSSFSFHHFAHQQYLAC